MLQFTENGILQIGNGPDKNWSVGDLLEAFEPLREEPFANRREAMLRVAEMAEGLRPELSETARLRLNFWKKLRSWKISQSTCHFETKVSLTYHWEVTINGLGIFYKDISGEYAFQPGAVSEQLLSDFWFYGPLRPVPDLPIRQALVETIKNAFDDPGDLLLNSHFELFGYPKIELPLHWEKGDWKASDGIYVRNHGIDLSSSNWRDGPTYLGCVSFEHFLNAPPNPFSVFTPEIRADIERFLSRKSIFSKEGIKEPEQEAEPMSAPEREIRSTDDGVELVKIAQKMLAEGVPDAENLFYEVAKTAEVKAKQGLAHALAEAFNSEKAVEIYRSLLELEVHDSYWRDHVFNRFLKMRNNPAVPPFVLDCLRGDNEMHFKKALDVLRYWGAVGDTALADRNLYENLNWNDATANDPDFRAALETVGKILGG
ncbi:MAG: hypothetical protein ABMA02_09940 [Saprospiraceae bacterium]